MGSYLSTVTYYPGYSQTQTQPYPKKHLIDSITQSDPMIVTTVEPHHYHAGQNVAFIIPGGYGMPQLNKINANIIDVTTDTITLDFDSTNFSPFSYPNPLPLAYSLPYVIPNAEGPQPEPALPYGNQNSFFGALRNREII